jgi:hypothetical protein
MDAKSNRTLRVLRIDACKKGNSTRVYHFAIALAPGLPR